MLISVSGCSNFRPGGNEEGVWNIYQGRWVLHIGWGGNQDYSIKLSTLYKSLYWYGYTLFAVFIQITPWCQVELSIPDIFKLVFQTLTTTTSPHHILLSSCINFSIIWSAFCVLPILLFIVIKWTYVYGLLSKSLENLTLEKKLLILISIFH